MADPDNNLPPQVNDVLSYALARGVKDLFIVDKPDETAYAVAGGKIVKSMPCVTGVSNADDIPASARQKGPQDTWTSEEKATPAGQFTMSPMVNGSRKGWVINEIEGGPPGNKWGAVVTSSPAVDQERQFSPAARHQSRDSIFIGENDMADVAKIFDGKPSIALYVTPQDPSPAAMAKYFPAQAGGTQPAPQHAAQPPMPRTAPVPSNPDVQPAPLPPPPQASAPNRASLNLAHAGNLAGGEQEVYDVVHGVRDPDNVDVNKVIADMAKKGVSAGRFGTHDIDAAEYAKETSGAIPYSQLKDLTDSEIVNHGKRPPRPPTPGSGR